MTKQVSNGLLLSVVGIASACSQFEVMKPDLSTVKNTTKAEPEDTTSSVEEPIDGGTSGQHVYAVMFEVFNDDTGSDSYLALVNSFDIERLETSDSREFAGGRAFVQTHNGKVFVGDPGSPVITRFAVTDDLKLQEDGALGLGNYGLEVGSLDDWNATFVSPTKAYLFDFKEARTIVWDPTTMEITGTIEGPKALTRQGFTLEGSPAVVRGKYLYRAFNWVNYETFDYSDEVLLGVYDVETDELVELVEDTRCPALGNLVHQDEEGNIYFSNWIWNVGDTLLYDGPESCVLRVKPNESTFDRDWALRYTEYTDGKQGAMFSYLSDGKALFAAFHDENLTFDEQTDPYSYTGSQNWSIWGLGLATNLASKLKGLKLNAGAFTPLTLEGRSFIMVPNSTWTSTQLFEVKGDQATPGLDIPGWSYQVKQVR